MSISTPDRPKASPGKSLAGWQSPSALLLVVTNLLPFYGVLAWDWSARSLLALYWCEIVVVGLISVLRLFFYYPLSLGYWLAKVVACPLLPLLLMPYLSLVLLLGMLTFGLLAPDMNTRHAFVSVLFVASNSKELMPLDQALATLLKPFDLGTQVSAVALAASHLFSFCWNYLGRGECNRVSIANLVFHPFIRIWLMLLAVGGALFGIEAAGVDLPPPALFLIIGVKTYLDLRSHLAEHRFTPPTVATQPADGRPGA